ncbi:MAG: tRNA uridine-5-carboxymethylaminomethyl(34) synthesis GTPase MnmE [Chlorobiales bacterium]|nr:tRNA uridine-5-carboxymethylaminomethyl(34) synthesis GTPase MnmE [Chlorobiales bacterium]
MDDLQLIEDHAHHPHAPSQQLEPIAAIATPVGEGAISIVRMSGEGVLKLADKLFRKHGDKPFSFQTTTSHTAHYGQLLDAKGNLIDEAIAIVYRSPRSFTTEDMVEFNCHGGIIVTENVLQSLLEAGCRLAEPGEFTRRAFLNGRIDLLQAEAIGEMIHAKTQTAYRSAMSQLKGDLSRKLDALRTDLLNCCSMLELELDFSEEDVEFQSREELREKMHQLLDELQSLAETFQLGKIVREGVATAIVGRPNAGKSTLLNALLGKERAIVSHTPGTTRDYIEEGFVHEGVLFRLIDTAGIRHSEDEVESEGIRRSYEKVSEADLIIYVYDASKELSPEEQIEIEELRAKNPHAKFLVAANKIDRLSEPASSIVPHLHERLRVEVIPISALNRVGFQELWRVMKSFATGIEKLNEGSVVVTNMRHYQAILQATDRLVAALELVQAEAETELVASDLREALHQIGSITGKVTTEDILNTIFEKFCIGK